LNNFKFSFTFGEPEDDLISIGFTDGDTVTFQGQSVTFGGDADVTW